MKKVTNKREEKTSAKMGTEQVNGKLWQALKSPFYRFTNRHDEIEEIVPIEQEKFISKLKFSINTRFAEILAEKQKQLDVADQNVADKKQRKTDPELITLLEATTIANYVRGVFVSRLKFVPKQIESALVLSEATIEPSTIKKIKLFKRAVGLAGGLGGVGTIAIATMVGLGIGSAATAGTAWATITAWFTTSVAIPYFWPITIALGGAGVAAFAMYFSATGTSAERAEKFKKALINSCEAAVKKIWDKYADQLSADVSSNRQA